jgi:hypothetical protein
MNVDDQTTSAQRLDVPAQVFTFAVLLLKHSTMA